MQHNSYTHNPEQANSSIDDLIDTVNFEASLGLNERQHEAMDNLDKLSCRSLWRSHQMIDICGLVSGVKPAALVKHDNQALDLMSELGLHMQSMNPGVTLAVSRSKDLSNELANVFDASRIKHQPGGASYGHRLTGRMLGYPETATEYFLKRLPTIFLPLDKQLPMIKPAELEGTVRSHFHQFVLSPDYWREEVNNYVVPLEDATRQYAPQTYRQFERRTKRAKVTNALAKLIGRQSSSDFGPDIAVSKVE